MDTLRTATARPSPLECVGYQVRYTGHSGQPDTMLIADQARAHELARHHRGTVSACVLLSDVIAERQQMAELVAELERTITTMRLTIDQRRAAIASSAQPEQATV